MPLLRTSSSERRASISAATSACSCAVSVRTLEMLSALLCWLWVTALMVIAAVIAAIVMRTTIALNPSCNRRVMLTMSLP